MIKGLHLTSTLYDFIAVPLDWHRIFMLEDRARRGIMANEALSHIHKQLQEVLSQEITLRQEILGNMSQQEYVLLIGNVALKKELHVECNKLIHHLQKAVRKRGGLTRMLFDSLPPEISGNTLDAILDPLVDFEGETLFLYQKTKKIIEKIHSQHLRNKILDEMIRKKGPLGVDNSPLHSTVHKKGSKKPLLIIIDYPDEKEEI